MIEFQVMSSDKYTKLFFFVLIKNVLKKRRFLLILCVRYGILNMKKNL